MAIWLAVVLIRIEKLVIFPLDLITDRNDWESPLIVDRCLKYIIQLIPVYSKK